MKDIFDEIAPDVESAQPDVFDVAEQSFKPADVADPAVSRVPAFVPTPALVSEAVKEQTWETLSPGEKASLDIARGGQAAVKGVGSVVRGIGIAAATMPPVPMDESGIYQPANAELYARWWAEREKQTPKEKRQQVVENPAYQAGAKIEAAAERLFPSVQPVSVKRPVGALAEGIGSTVSFLPGALGGPQGVAFLGALQSGATAYEDAVQAGAPEDKAQSAFFINALGGTSEALPISRIFNRLNKATGGTVWKAIKDMTVSGLEEGTQEVFQAVLQNAAAKHLYEKERKYLEGLATSGGVGFGVGFLLAALGIGIRRTASAISQRVDESREKDVFDQAIERNANRVAVMGTLPEMAQRETRRVSRINAPEGAVSPEAGGRVRQATRNKRPLAVNPQEDAAPPVIGEREIEPVAPAFPEAEAVAKEIGATFKPVSAVKTEGIPPEYAAQLEAIRKQNGWEFTPQAGSPIEGQTFYVPEGSSREDILKRYQEKIKANEVVPEPEKPSPQPLPEAKAGTPLAAGKEPSAGPTTGKPFEVKAYRGISEANLGERAGSSHRFYSESEGEASGYGKAEEKVVRFENPLVVENWMAAKLALKLPRSTTMTGVLDAAKKTGHDGVVWNHHGKREFVELGEALKGGDNLEAKKEVQGKEVLNVPPVSPGAAASPEAVVPPVKARFKPGDTVYVRMSDRQTKQHRAVVRQVQPDGDVTVKFRSGPNKGQAQTFKGKLVDEPKAAMTRKLNEAQLEGLSPEEKSKAKKDAKEFRDLVRIEGPRFDWYNAEVEHGAGDTQGGSMQQEAELKRGIARAFKAAQLEGHPENQLHQARALQAFKDYIKAEDEHADTSEPPEASTDFLTPEDAKVAEPVAEVKPEVKPVEPGKSSVYVPTAAELKNLRNRREKRLVETRGKLFARKYLQAVQRLFAASDILDYRESGPVVLKNGKAVLQLLADTDSSVDKWRVASEIDVTDQFQSKPAEPTQPVGPAAEAKPAVAPVSNLETLQKFMGALRRGEVTADQVKQAFRDFKTNRGVILGDLNNLTVADLKKRMNFPRNEKKDVLIRMVLDGYGNSFAPKGVSYVMGEEGAADKALETAVAGWTDEEIQKQSAERKARIDKVKKSITNPETLEEFDNFVRYHKQGYEGLNSEQKIKYDDLLAAAGRERRNVIIKQQAAVPKVALPTGVEMKLVETRHTQKGHELFVVQINQRVEREKYDELNTRAKKLRGRYSSYNKGGAVPGFTFTDKAAAEQFMSLEAVAGGVVVEQKQEAKKESGAARLREQAETLKKNAEFVLNQDRKVNTRRRAGMAESIEGRARADLRMSETMANLADAIESGEAVNLNGVRTKSHVEELNSILASAKGRRSQQTNERYDTYSKREPTLDDIEAARYPDLMLDRDILNGIGNNLEKVSGGKQMGRRLRERASYASELSQVQISRAEAEVVLDKLGKRGAWQVEAQMDRLKRLEAMGIPDIATLRAALREYLTYRGRKQEADPIKAAERELIGTKIPGFFPTPKPLAAEMVQRADIEAGMDVLEPSAGNGNIADAIKETGVEPTVIEINPTLRALLEKKGYKPAGVSDFLEHGATSDKKYDRIVMNPPFENGQDIDHVRHAYSLLKPGGKVVAIMSEGPFFRNDSKATGFRAWLESVDGTSEKLPENSFKGNEQIRETGTNARLVEISKPAEKKVEPEKPAVQMRPLTKAEAKEFSDLSKIARAARENNAPGLNTEQTQRYQHLESLAGAQDLPIEPAKPEEPQAGPGGKLVVPKGNLTLTGETQQKTEDQEDLFNPKPPRDTSIGDRSESEVQRAGTPPMSDAALRREVNKPDSGVPDEMVRYINALLDSGLTNQIPGLSWAINDAIHGGATGEYLPESRLASFSRFADSKTPIHEFFHDVWYFLKPEDQAAIRSLREQAIQEQLSKPNPYGQITALEKMQNEEVTSDDFINEKFPTEIYHLSNEREFFTWLMTDRAAAHFDSQPETKSFIGRIKDVLQRLWTAIKDAVGLSPKEDALWRKILAGKYEFTPQEGREFEARELARPEPLKQAVEMFERKAAVDPTAARRAVEIGQAANVLARQGMVQWTLTNLEGIARGEAATPQQKWLRDLAAKVLANPFIRNALRRPVERLNASASYTGDTIETYQTLKAKSDATPEQVSNAAGEAVNDIVSWEQRVADFNSAYLAKRQSLTNGIAKTTEAEMEAYDKLDAADVLLSDFRSMALPILRQSNDTTALQAYTYALGRSQAVRNVLAWVGREVDLTGASTPADVLNLIREAGGRSRIQESIEQQIGAERGVIQAVSRIIALVEPIRERLLEARFLYRQQAQTRSTELKQRLERLVAQGSYARALEVFERGAEKLGAEQDRARRELDFYARRTRQQLLALRALDEVKAISERISNDPGFQAEKRDVFGESAQNVRNVMVDIRGSTFVLKPFGGMTEELHLTFGNPTAQSRASLEQIKTYRDRAMAYIASENADPSVAQGLKATFPLLEQFLNPAVSPEAERLLPNFMLKGFHALLRRIGAPERIPYYLLQGAGGTWKAVADATLRARRDMGEQLQRINKAHFPKMSLALHAALKSHGEITPDTYFEKVWNHLAGSRQNFRDIRYLNEGDPIGNGEKVTKEDLAYLEAYRKFHTDLSATSQNIGKRQFSSFRSVLTGIFFDKDGRVRLPFAQGVDMVNRRQPPQYEIEDWLNKWRAAKTPDAKSEFLTDYLDRLVIGYMHGVNQADWVRKFPYSYEAQIREILAESAEQPIDSFGTLVDRVFEKVTVEENEVLPTWEDVRNNLLFDFDSIFKKLERLDTTQKQTDPKNIVETVRSEREFNTERGDVIMPPNWYDYGGTTEGQWSSVSRASMFPYERAHLVAINGIKDALSAVVKDFTQQSKARKDGFRGYFRTKRESRKARERGELIYSWADAKELLDKVTHYAAGLNMMADQPELLTQTDRPYAVLQSGVTQLPVAMVLFRLGAASRNLFGGYTNALLADMAFRNRSWAISVPLRSAELVADTYKNLLTALVHEGNPVGRKIHSLLSSASSRAVIGPIAENFLKAIDEQRQLYRDAAELGLNLNVALWDSLSTLRKFSKTAGSVREPTGSPLEQVYSVPAAALRMGGMVFGQAGVGKIDSWINTKAYIQARQYEQIYKKMARKYGEQVIAMGLDQFPQNAFGGSYKAVKVREFFTRMAGLDIDAAMRDYYKRWSEAETDSDKDLVPLFTEEQRNTLAVATADDFNLATFSNRPYSTKMHSMLNTLGLFYGYPDWWIHKLLSTANLNSRKGLTEGRLENMPFLLNYALLFALASIMGMEGVEWLKEWLLNQKSAYPTLTDAKTAPAAVRAAAGAVAFNTPFIGGAVSSAFDLGYHGSNNPYDLFFIPGMLKAAANVGIETWQTGEPVLPVMKFADRYLLPLPSHKLTDTTAGTRALINTGNILEMSARANDDEEKLKPRDTAGFQRDYTPATPIITRAMNAIGNGDMPEFQKEYNALVQEYRRQGKSDPERNARQSLMTRNPISQRFAKRPTEAEFSKYLSGLTETERKIVTDTLNNYRQAMGIIGAAPSFTAGEARGGGSTSFRPTGSAVTFATAGTGTPARFGGGRVRSALSTSRSRYPRRVRGVRTRLTAARRRPRRVSRIMTSRVRRAKLPRFSARIRRPRRIRISPRRQFV